MSATLYLGPAEVDRRFTIEIKMRHSGRHRMYSVAIGGARGRESTICVTLLV